jgi:NADH-quinone oxidoreductase subunit H
MFFLAEYAHMITGSALISVLFLGGWHFPWIPWTQPEATQGYAVLSKMAVLSLKIAVFIFVMMWIRWTLPRFRYDQLMRLAWKSLIPITLALVVLSAGLLYVGLHRSIWALLGNGVIVGVALAVAAFGRREVTGRAPSFRPMPRAAM